MLTRPAVTVAGQRAPDADPTTRPARLVPEAHAWWVLLVASFILIAGYRLLSGLAQDIVYVVPGTLCGLVILAAASRAGPARVAWLLIGCGQLLFSAADATFAIQNHAFGLDPFPSVADALYLAGYPAIALGLVLLLRGRGARGWAAVLDATIVATCIGLVSWVFLMQPVAHDVSRSLPARIVAIAYPLADVVLLGVWLHLVHRVGRWAPAFWLLVLSIVSLFVADVAYGVQTLHGTYVDGSVIDVGWILSSALLAAAALHPSSRRMSADVAATARGITPARVAVLFGASLVGITVMYAQELAGNEVDGPVLFGGSLVLVGLALARMAGLLRDQAVREESDRREQVRLATERERADIARDLHDLVGHALGGVLLQARGARALLRSDPDRVDDGLAALTVIEQRSHEALAEMRLMLGILRPGSGTGTVPKRLRDIGALVDAARADAVDVALTVEGDLGAIPPGVDASAYRIIQEALTNATRHAPGGAVTVTVERGPAELRLTVVNTPGTGEAARLEGTAPDDHVPHGMIGMRERADLLGGDLDIGPLGSGGWAVHARLPLATG